MSVLKSWSLGPFSASIISGWAWGLAICAMGSKGNAPDAVLNLWLGKLALSINSGMKGLWRVNK